MRKQISGSCLYIIKLEGINSGFILKHALSTNIKLHEICSKWQVTADSTPYDTLNYRLCSTEAVCLRILTPYVILDQNAIWLSLVPTRIDIPIIRLS